MSHILRNARRYVQSWTTANNIVVRANGQVIGADIESAFSSIWLDYIEAVNVHNQMLAEQHKLNGLSGPAPKFKRMPKDELEAAWLEYPEKARAQMQRLLIEQIMPYTGDNDELEKWLGALIGPDIKEIDLAIMKHFLWQVKRKAADLPVVYHICPIFFGKQGGGKTTAIEKLLSPIKDLTLSFSPDEATDNRVKAAFGKNLVCFFDEMANMARVEMEELKKLITAETLTYRPMHTNKSAVAQQKCSFIGGSNKSMAELIYDPTGMRRFYEFVCMDKANFEAINSVDYSAVFAGIDGSLERGYVEHLLSQLVKHQQQRQSEDEIQHFVREMELLGGVQKEITAADLYASLILWRANAGYAAKQAMAVNSMGMRLSSFKIGKKVKRIGDRPQTVYYVNAASPIFSNKLAPVTMLRGNA